MVMAQGHGAMYVFGYITFTPKFQKDFSELRTSKAPRTLYYADKKGEHRSALRGTSRFGFAGVPNAPNIEQGEGSGVPTTFFMGANRTKKKQQTPFCATGLVRLL